MIRIGFLTGFRTMQRVLLIAGVIALAMSSAATAHADTFTAQLKRIDVERSLLLIHHQRRDVNVRVVGDVVVRDASGNELPAGLAAVELKPSVMVELLVEENSDRIRMVRTIRIVSDQPPAGTEQQRSSRGTGRAERGDFAG
jgi:hypothetical protein